MKKFLDKLSSVFRESTDISTLHNKFCVILTLFLIITEVTSCTNLKQFAESLNAGVRTEDNYHDQVRRYIDNYDFQGALNQFFQKGFDFAPYRGGISS